MNQVNILLLIIRIKKIQQLKFKIMVNIAEIVIVVNVFNVSIKIKIFVHYVR